MTGARLRVGLWLAAAITAAITAVVMVAGVGTASAQSAPPPVCSDPDNFTHCEQVVDRPGCNPALVYDNYTGDDFRSPFGPPAVPGTYINVRNAPYRRYGPRGVVVFYHGDWGFMSGNCLTGGL